MDHIFLTYDEAGKKLGIKPDSVRRRARARKWPRRQGNDGKAQVGIPPDILGEDSPSGDPSGHPLDKLERTAIIEQSSIEAAELRVENRMLREQMDELRSDRDKWREQAERLLEVRSTTGFFNRLFRR